MESCGFLTTDCRGYSRAGRSLSQRSVWCFPCLHLNNSCTFQGVFGSYDRQQWVQWPTLFGCSWCCFHVLNYPQSLVLWIHLQRRHVSPTVLGVCTFHVAHWATEVDHLFVGFFLLSLTVWLLVEPVWLDLLLLFSGLGAVELDCCWVAKWLVTWIIWSLICLSVE